MYALYPGNIAHSRLRLSTLRTCTCFAATTRRRTSTRCLAFAWSAWNDWVRPTLRDATVAALTLRSRRGGGHLGLGALQHGVQLDAARGRHREAGHLHAWCGYLPRLLATATRELKRCAGGIGKSIESVEQLEALTRPLTMETGGMVLMDLLWRRAPHRLHACICGALTASPN